MTKPRKIIHIIYNLHLVHLLCHMMHSGPANLKLYRYRLYFAFCCEPFMGPVGTAFYYMLHIKGLYIQATLKYSYNYIQHVCIHAHCHVMHYWAGSRYRKAHDFHWNKGLSIVHQGINFHFALYVFKFPNTEHSSSYKSVACHSGK